MFRDFLERRRIRRTIENLVDTVTVEALLRDDERLQPIKPAHIELVIGFVRGDDPTQVSERVGKIAVLAVQHGATVHGVVAALVIVAFGVHPASPAGSGSRASLIAALSEQFRGDIKIVHGAADGSYGLFGNERRLSDTFLVPQFDQILGMLSRLQFGAIEEFAVTTLKA